MSNELAVPGGQAQVAAVNAQSFPILSGGQDIGVILKKNFGQRRLNPNLLPKITVSSGNKVGFDMPTLDENPKTLKEFIALCVLQIDARRFWNEPMDQRTAKTPPDCASDDLDTGRGDPGGKCDNCSYSQWGSAKGTSRAQACQDRKILFLLLPGDTVPTVFNIPPTSLVNVQRFMLSLANAKVEFDQAYLKFVAEAAENENHISFTKVQMYRVGMIDEGALPVFQKYCRDTIPFLRQRKVNEDFNDRDDPGAARTVKAEAVPAKSPGAAESKAAFRKADEKTAAKAESQKPSGGVPDDGFVSPEEQARRDLEELEQLSK